MSKASVKPTIISQAPLYIEPLLRFRTAVKPWYIKILVNISEKVALRLLITSDRSQSIFKNTVVGMPSVRKVTLV